MKTKLFAILGLFLILFGSSCVSSRKYKAQKKWLDSVNSSFAKSQSDLNACETAKANYLKQIEELKKQEITRKITAKISLLNSLKELINNKYE